MRYIFNEKVDLESLSLNVKQMENDDQIRTICVYTTYDNSVHPAGFHEVLASCTKPIFGAFFPGIIYRSTVFMTGYLLIGFDSRYNIRSHIIHKLGDRNIHELEKDVRNLNFTQADVQTVLITVDAFSKGIKNLLNAFFNIYSLNYNFIGGGAGAVDFIPRPCLFDNNGIYQDSALIVTIDVASIVGTNHGFNPIDGPFLVTRSYENIIEEIEYEPAFDFYKKIIAKHHPHPVVNDNFFEIFKNYPLGIPKLQSDAIIREAAKIINNASIECFSPFPKHTSIFVMNGNNESFIKGSIQASLEADQEKVDSFAFVLDCFSRANILGDEYSKMLNLIRLRDEMLIGALNIGEIASKKKDYLEYLNKTCVITRFIL